MRGLDYSAGRISGAAIRQAGFEYVIRYIDDPARGLTSKHVRPDEYADLRSSGVQVWLVCERTIQDSQGGFASGVTLAQAARKGADWIGYPRDGLIFFTADRHLLPAEVTKALAMLDGAASVLGRAATGCYGFSELVNAAAAQGKAGAYWLAGSKPTASSPAHIWQRNDGFVKVGGVTCDINEMLRPLPTGSHPPPVPPPPEAHGMDAATLRAVMGNRPGVPYEKYLAPFIDGMVAAHCTTINRAAMWCAQLGTESGGLQWMRELASGAEYEGRTNLGNTQKGDGVRYAGRGPIQLTGRANYGAFSRWAAAQGYVTSPTHFVDNPTLLEDPKWGFLAASYYWTVARADINTYADKGDVTTVTKRINGGTNGLADRQKRYDDALKFGARLLPPNGEDMAQVPQNEWDSLNRDLRADLAHKQQQIDALVKQASEQGQILRMVFEQLAGAGADPLDPAKMFPGWECYDGADRTLVDIGRRNLQQLAAIESKLA